MKLINWVKDFFKSLFRKAPKPPTIEPDMEEQDQRDDNIDTDKPDDLGIPEVLYEEGQNLLFYPIARLYDEPMRTRGTYKKRYPQGAIVHFTAGRSRNAETGGKRNATTHHQQGKRGVDSAIRKGSFCYFVIDRDGGVHQPFSLDRWGYHAGKSSWKGLSGGVSDELVGIEIQNAGRLEKAENGKYKAWFTKTEKGDSLFGSDEVRVIPEQNDNQQPGAYHKFSEAQERALVELLIWLKRNNPEVFRMSYILGHDEVAGKKGIGYNRKNDPGGSLSMTMSDLRVKVINEYKDRYGSV